MRRNPTWQRDELILALDLYFRHHTVPVSELHSTQGSKLEDVALVCANCHRMLHRRRPWLGLSDLQELIISPNRGNVR